ncbi:MAG: hypothetical protein ABI024_06240 [Vicinamibacterales bacterium]
MFGTRSGDLIVERDGDMLSMDFPACSGRTIDAVVAALGTRPFEAILARDLVAVFDAEADVRGSSTKQ